MKIGRRDLEGLRLRPVALAFDAVAGLAVALIHGLPTRNIGWIFLGLEERYEQEADEA